MKRVIFSLSALFFTVNLMAQDCPPASAKGMHVVQKGETLYGIARKYKIQMRDLAQQNNMNPADVLRPCTELSIGSGAVVNSKSPQLPVPDGSGRPFPRPYNTVVTTSKSNTSAAFAAKTYTVKSGDRLDEIAAKYGYTAARLRAINKLSSTDKIFVGQELKLVECDCNDTKKVDPAVEAVEMADAYVNQAPTSYNNAPKPKQKVRTEYSDANEDLPSSYNSTTMDMGEIKGTAVGAPNYAYFKTSGYTPFYHIVSNNNETPEFIGNLYGLTGSDVMMMNNLKSNAKLALGQRVMLEDRTQPKVAPYVYDEAKNITDSKQQYDSDVTPQYLNQNKTQQNVPQNNSQEFDVPQSTLLYQDNQNKQPEAPRNLENEKPVSMSSSTTMSAEENEMVREINLVRSNPSGYIRNVEIYIADLKKNGNMGNSIQTAYELIEELKRTQPLSTLQPLQCIYLAARAHGEDQRRMNDTNHEGSDGSWPWDRVKRACPQLTDGNENLVGGPSNIRKAVMLLLVDDGIEGRGHRVTMLRPDWKYVACHKMGTIGTMPNCWVQKFGM